MDLIDLQDRLNELKSINSEMRNAPLELKKMREKEMKEIREKILKLKTKQKPEQKPNRDGN